MIKTLLTLLFIFRVFATDGLIRVHEAPILSKPSADGNILMLVRKGETIYLHPNHLNDEGYYTTLTRDGRKAYIRKDFIKLILNNESEDLGNTIYVQNDPTDYVIDEPLPEKYPLKGYPSNKANIDFVLRKGMTSHYNYSNQIERESTGFSGTLNLKYLRPARFDEENRLYFGFFGGISSGQNEYLLTDEIYTRESDVSFTIGPVISYTFYKRQFFEIESVLQVGANFQRTFITQDDVTNGVFEEKLFTGLSFNIRLGVNLTHKKFFNSDSAFLYHGPVIDIRLPSTLSSDGQFENPQLWTATDLATDLEGTFGYNVGITYIY